jgi:hypothetical protein
MDEIKGKEKEKEIVSLPVSHKFIGQVMWPTNILRVSLSTMSDLTNLM